MSEPIIYVDGEFLPEPEFRIPLLTHGLHYGTGVFEGIRAYHVPSTGETYLFRAKAHFERMTQNVKFLNFTLPLPPEGLTQIAVDLIRRNSFTSDVYVRPLVYKSANRVGVTLPTEQCFAMLAVPMGQYLDTGKGLNCCISSWRRINDNAIPCRAKICGAYAGAALAAQDARDQGFDEAIVLNEDGHVAEGSAMNLFLVRNSRLVTPDASQGILEGITRDTLMILAQDTMGLKTQQRAVNRTELYVADEVFLCGTAAQVAPVTRIDGRPVGNGKVGPLTLQLQETYEQLVRGRLRGYEQWLEPVYGPMRQTRVGVA